MFFCKACKGKSEKTFNKCPACGKYQTCEKGGPTKTMLQAGEAIRINEIDLEGVHRIQTGTREFDRVLGGEPAGMVQGSLVLIGGEPGKGKLQSLDSRILTLAGWSTMGEMKVGTLVIGADGRPTRVAGVHPQGCVLLYRVTLSDGGETLCGAEHLWTTRNRRERLAGRPGKVRTTREIMDTICRSDGGLMHSIPFVQPVHFKAGKKLPLHPYIIGMYLADGSMMASSVTITKPERDIISRIASLLPAGDEIKKISPSNNVDKKSCIISKKIRGPLRSKTAQALMSLGLAGKSAASKFVPHQYLYASLEDRLWLLRGLLDGDGHVGSCSDGTTIEYATISDLLAKACVDLVLGLGGRVTTEARQTSYTHKGEKKLGQPSYHLRISFCNPSIIPVASDKHLARFRHVTRLTERFIASVEAQSVQPAQCITVEAPDGLYVTDDYIVTHNSTLCLQVGCELAEADFDPCTVLYVSGEETPKQVRERAERIMMDTPPTKMYFMAETNLEKIAEKVLAIDPDVLVIDSIQTMRIPESGAGQHTQLTESVKFLTGITKARGLTTLIVSHVNKDGDLAGPKAVEHYVDVVLSFDAERSSDVRTLRALKNRFGDTTEVGIFRMTSDGLKSIDNPSEHLIRGKRGAPGSCIACVMLNPGEGTGTRSMLFEVQALVSPPAGKSGVRVSQGYATKRLDMILAILSAHTAYGAASAADVYVNVTPSGFSIDESSLDLPVALAITSSLLRVPVPPGVVAWGEMGLTGEVRPDDYGALRAKLSVATAMKFKSPLYSTREAIQTISEALSVLSVSEPSQSPTEEKLAEMGLKKKL